MKPTMKPKIQYGDQTLDTFCEINGIEHDVLVSYHTSPAEPDVNWAGDLEIQGVYLAGEDVMGDMTDAELTQLVLRVNEEEDARTDPSNYEGC